MTNKPYLLALNRLAGVGPKTAQKLLRRWPNLEELFRLTPKDIKQFGLPEQLAMAIEGFDMAAIEQDLYWEQGAANHYLLTWEDEAYPSLLKEIYDPPLVLYAKGDLSCLAYPTIAVVGTRNPSITGSETAWTFAYELAQQAITIVSGLALGIDRQAHYGCLQAKGCTIAVMATGIDTVYPTRHQSLAEKLVANGLLLTEFPLKTSPSPGHFPRRNRIISGLSLATLVVEAAIKSGSLITARLALEQNRDVLAVPGSIHNPKARGCHYLLQQGAKLVTSSADILNELGLHVPSSGDSLLYKQGETNELAHFIGFEVTAVDQIVMRSGLSVEKVTCGLAALELQGVIKMVPGGYMRSTR